MRRKRSTKECGRSLGTSVVEEVVFVDDEVPTIGAVLAPVGEDVAGLGKLLGIERLHQVGAAAAVDAHDDGVNRHASATVYAHTP